MSEIGSVQPLDRPAPVVAPVPVAAPARSAEPERGGTPLEPAVKLDLGGGAEVPSPGASQADYRNQIVRDADTRSMVYQVVDPLSGDIVVQLPSVTVLKARAYAQSEAARAAETARSAGNQTGLDRSA